MTRTRRDGAAGLLRRALLPLALIGSSVAGCRPADDAGRAEGEPAAAAVEIPTEVEAAVVALGSEAAREFAGALVGRLQEALATEGPAGAVSFCAAEGLPLTAAASREAGFEIKRTSDRIRNPANAPDSLEEAALRHFRAAAPGDSLPGVHVQRTPEGDFRYYQPLRIQPLCVQCHGSTGELEAGVAEALAEHYPDDEATGYAVGDFRGLIRVSVPAAAAERMAVSGGATEPAS